MGSSASSQASTRIDHRPSKTTALASPTTTSTTASASPSPLTQASTVTSPHDTQHASPQDNEGDNMEQVAIRTGRSRMNTVDLHSVCGYTSHGVPAFSNGTSETWTNSKSYMNGVFMGYKWQCVEFARRWLWSTQRLLLPERSCAYCFSGCKHVYRLKDDPLNPRVSPNGAGAGTFSSPGSVETNAAFPTEQPAEVLGPRKNAKAWEKVPAVFVKQGSLVPPVPNSLIVYPMSWGSPWGHIGVITEVDLERGLVYVADQNRYFHDWGHHTYSAVFPLEVSLGRFYIRDHESECKGWLTFPSNVENH